MTPNMCVCVVSPFELPDVRLALETVRCGAFAYLHLGRDASLARSALMDLARGTTQPFGVALATSLVLDDIPPQVTRVLLPWGTDDSAFPGTVERVWQVSGRDDARAAIGAGATALAVKGNDASGLSGEESTFILFQAVLPLARDSGVALFVHGGAGVHTGAAYLSLGAAGVHLDSQVVLLPECGAPRQLKAALGKLDGTQTTRIGGFRVLKWPAMPAARDFVEPFLGGLDLEANLLPMGQDFALAADYLARYGRLEALLGAIEEARYGHVRQAQNQQLFQAGSPMAESLGTRLPVVQGPMARVSDEPGFADAVARAGALPVIAAGMAGPDSLRDLLIRTAHAVQDQPWGVGLLGFVQPAAFDAQAQAVLGLDRLPSAVIIAGGRPAQGERFEKAGIAAYLHVPSARALDADLAQGARRFIFEGRESGGHVAGLHSAVMWERQILHLLDFDDCASVSVLFAGGIHDQWSAAFVAVMAASLAARGTRVGLQVGTAYLATAEAVTSGAITANFRDLVVGATRTVLLESAPGQETRAVPTPFADAFAAEKARLESLGLEPLAVRLGLEELNLGRARVAAKGRDRSGESHQLVDLSVEDQRREGLYMAGSVAALIDEPLTLEQLHGRLTAGANELVACLPGPEPALSSRLEPIAIIGMAALFPDAPDIDDFWLNNLTGRDSVAEVPVARWDPELFYDPDSDNTDFVASKWGAFVQPSPFDPLEFGMPPASVPSVEPAQLLSLVVAKRALEDAGYGDAIKDGLPDTSVVFGVEAMGELSNAYGSRPGIRAMLGDLPQQIDEILPRLDEDSFAGILSNVTAGRIANRLNCGGRNFTVDAACASSLAALDVACQELWSGRSSMVICGGTDLHNGIFDYALFSSARALSRRGYCATFDESGDGLALGEGVGAVILKPLSAAERDGDRIYAVIRGIHGSSDGRSMGLTAPNRNGQTKALRRAYLSAGVAPGEVGLVEAHGTGTAVGDRAELAALSEVMLDGGALPGRTWVGSVKTQIGHPKCAAGLAGLIRTAFAVRHGVIPPTLHLEKPVKSYRPGQSPFIFNASGRAGVWMSQRRVAGLSGFGFGGTNFHAVIENYRDGSDSRLPAAAAWPAELLLVRGATIEQAREQLRVVARAYQANHHLRLRDVAYWVATSGDEPVQIGVVAQSWPDLLDKVDLALAGSRHPDIFYREPVAGKVAFLFPGQGSQKVNMARDLFVVFSQPREHLRDHPGYEDILFPPSVFSEAGRQDQQARLTETANAQPLLGLVDLAIAELLESFGITPDAVAGHSYGELPALAYAGVIGAGDLFGLSVARAQAMMSAAGGEAGTMVALSQSPEQTDELLRGRQDLWAANYNTDSQVVVGGTHAAVDALLAECRQRGIGASRLDVACAFHTPLLAGSDKRFAEALAAVPLGTASLPVWSNLTGQPYPETTDEIRARLAEQLVSPVRFADELKAMYDDGVTVFIEAGPGKVLTGLAEATLGGGIVAIRTEAPGAGGIRTFLRALAQWVASGRDIDIEHLFAGRGVKKLDLVEPETYRTSATTWMVDGLEAVPLKDWVEQGEQHQLRGRLLETQQHLRSIMTPDNPMREEPTTPAAPAAPHDALVYAYLQNMRAMLDDQRDIMLAAMGYGQGTAPTPGAAIEMMPPMPAMPLMPAMSPVPGMPAMVTPTTTAMPVAAGTTGGEDAAVEAGDTSWSLPRLQDLDAGQIQAVVLDVVSDKTGYPISMLGLDMDLEADLSIDSIKRLEIIGSFSEKVAMPAPEDAGEEDAASALEELVSIKTLRGMVDWLQRVARGIGDQPDRERPANDAAPEPAAPEPAVTPITRMVWVREDHPYWDHPADLTGHSFVVTSGPFANAIAAELDRRGATAHILAPGETPNGSNGVIFVAGAESEWGIKELFDLLKAMNLSLTTHVAVFDDTLATVMRSGPADIGRLQGFSGLVKTLQQEYPDIRFTTVTSATPFTAEVFPAMAVREVADDAGYPEVGYEGSTRVRYVPQVQERGDSADLGAGLDESSVVVVLGGAQGISPAITATVAAAVPCRYILVGRTPRDADLAREYADCPSRAEVQKRVLATQQLDEPKQVHAVVERIMKAKSIEDALARVGATGATADYASVDVRDAEALRDFLDGVRTTYGGIDALFHAAGALEDKLFKAKDWSSFERVYTTKTTPLPLIAALADQAKLVVLFSSMSGAFGNRGQCDYAAANSVLDTAATVLAERGSRAKVVSIAWGPWKGAGMVTPGLEEEMGKRGLALLPPDEGSAFFWSEVNSARDANVIAMAGDPSNVRSFIETSLSGLKSNLAGR